MRYRILKDLTLLVFFMKSLLLLFFIEVSTSSSFAQKIKLIEGSLAALKGQKAYNIKFVYDNMKVGRDIPEDTYLQDKKTEWEGREKGKGIEFVENWFGNRKKMYEPAFIKSFERYSYLSGSDSTAKYTLIVKTIRTEGGWNVGVSFHPGMISGYVLVVERSNPEVVLARISFMDFQGKDVVGGDFDMGFRIRSAYAMTGRWFGDFLRRKTK